MYDWLNQRQVGYWEDRGLPHSVALMQVAWARRQAVVRMRERGMTHAAIAKVLHVTPSRIADILLTAKHRKGDTTPPVMAYLTRWGEWRKLTQSMRAMSMISWLAKGGIA